jgi:hypothetical protein
VRDGLRQVGVGPRRGAQRGRLPGHGLFALPPPLASLGGSALPVVQTMLSNRLDERDQARCRACSAR